jgi:ribosome-associated protein
MSGTSSRHITGVTQAIEQDLHKDKIKPLFSGSPSQSPDSGWIVLDFVSVVTHIFLKPQREFYSLEHLWQDAKRVKITSGYKKGNENRRSRRNPPVFNK